jgi:hypothetical protein
MGPCPFALSGLSGGRPGWGAKWAHSLPTPFTPTLTPLTLPLEGAGMLSAGTLRFAISKHVRELPVELKPVSRRYGVAGRRETWRSTICQRPPVFAQTKL